MKKQKGITLIALVITIIVLLILAGVSINLVIGDNGILKQAQNAVTINKESSMLEDISFAWTSCTTMSYMNIGQNQDKSIYYNTENMNKSLDNKGNVVSMKYRNEGNSTINYIPVGESNEYTFSISQEGNVEMIAKLGKRITEETGNTTINSGIKNYKNPIIPVGFAPVISEGGSWDIVSDEEISGWNEGLIIQDSNGNQFVWVPVDGTDVKYERWCTNTTSYEDCNEDAILGGSIDQYQQINENGGFWIGRFEAGRPNLDYVSPITNNVTSGVELMVQRGAQPWDYINYNTSKIVSEQFLNNEYVSSGLVTGTQWDTVTKWIGNTYGMNKVINGDENIGTYVSTLGITFNGRYSTAPTNPQEWKTGEVNKVESGIYFIGCGMNEKAATKNIYDLAGNLFEWTSEVSKTNSEYAIARAGSGDTSATQFPMSSRIVGNQGAASTFYSWGFRIALFCK